MADPPSLPDSRITIHRSITDTDFYRETKVETREKIERGRETVAATISLGLFTLFFLTVTFPLYQWTYHCGLVSPSGESQHSSNPSTCPAPEHTVVGFVEAMAAHEIVLLGIIIAFYFSERRQTLFSDGEKRQ